VKKQLSVVSKTNTNPTTKTKSAKTP